VILDVNMPLGDGLGICEMIAPDETLAAIPIIILTGRSDRQTVECCKRLGAHYVLKSTDVWQRVEPLIHEVLEPSPVGERVEPQVMPSNDPIVSELWPQKGTVLIADDDRDLTQVLELRCRQMGADVVVAYDAMTALEEARRHRPDLICLDVNMPSGSGLSVCEMLYNDDELSAIPVIMLTGKTDEDTIRRCHAMCAYYVLKSSDIWQRVGPIIRELLGVQDASPARPETFEPFSGSAFERVNEEVAREVAFANMDETM